MENRDKPRRYLFNRLVLFVSLLLALLVFFSNTLYSAFLPEVNIVRPSMGEVGRTVTMNCVVEYPQTATLFSPASYKVTELMVQGGQRVRVGEALFTFDTGEYQAQLAELELYVLQLTNEQASWANARRKAEIQLQMGMLQRQIDELNALYPADGIFLAPQAGTVNAVHFKQGEYVSTHTPLFDLTPWDAVPYARVALSAKEALAFEAITSVSAKYVRIDPGYGGGLATTVEEERSVESRVYDKERDEYALWINMSGSRLKQGQAVEIRLTAASPFYDLIVPLSAVHEDPNEKLTVWVLYEAQGVFGDEMRVKEVSVDRLAENESSMAVSAEDLNFSSDIVISTTRALSRGQRVKVVGE